MKLILKPVILIVVLFYSQLTFSQNTTRKEREIFGKITYLSSAIPDVNIVVVGTNNATQTDSKGRYSLRAKIGDKIRYSHVAFRTVTVVVEDITSELSLRLRPKENKLDEVVIKSNVTKKSALNKSIKSIQKFTTTRGKIDPRTAGFAVAFVDGDQISNAYPTIQEALRGKISGYVYDMNSKKAYLRGSGMSINNDYPASWEVDGVFSPEPPFGLDLSQIDNIYILKSLAATGKYGSQAAGGVIVINTKYGSIQGRKKVLKETTEKYTNKSYYGEDALSFNQKMLDENAYTNAIAAYNDKDKAIAYYNTKLKTLKDFSIQLTLAKKFAKQYKENTLAKEILNSLIEQNQNNPEVLKAVAYQMQSLGYFKEATRVYQFVYKLRPNYIQSLRDLSYSYFENEQYKRAWRIYLNGLSKHDEANDEGIGEILYSEMEWLYFNKKKEAGITQQFIAKNKTAKEFSKNVRILIEWNTSEAEFDLEFVNPEKQVYEFKHSLVDNETLITKEKTKGYSSKEFYIDSIGDGDWLFNLTYHGNKKSTPTYFKISIYYNWSLPNQTKTVKVLPIKDIYDKVEILKINQLALINQ